MCRRRSGGACFIIECAFGESFRVFVERDGRATLCGAAIDIFHLFSHAFGRFSFIGTSSASVPHGR